MDLVASLSGANAWLAPLGALAITLLVASALLLRDHIRLEQHTVSLEYQIERLQDRLWQLAESEEQHRSLIEAQVDLIAQHDAQRRIPFANDGYARLTGQHRSDLIGS